MGEMLQSHRLSMFEALTLHHRTGLTIPEIVRSTQVPSSTAHRIMKNFQDRSIVVTAGKQGKAPIYRLNGDNAEIVDLARVVHEYGRLRAEAEEEEQAARPSPSPG